MKYGHLSTEQLKQGLKETAEAMSAEVQFIRELSSGGFKLPTSGIPSFLKGPDFSGFAHSDPTLSAQI